MKTKKFAKKLALNKATVDNLTDTQQQSAKGGMPNTSVGHRYLCYTQCHTGVCCTAIDCPKD